MRKSLVVITLSGLAVVALAASVTAGPVTTSGDRIMDRDRDQTCVPDCDQQPSQDRDWDRIRDRDYLERRWAAGDAPWKTWE